DLPRDRDFAREALQRAGVSFETRPQEFQGDWLAKLEVVGAIELPDTPARKKRNNSVSARNQISRHEPLVGSIGPRAVVRRGLCVFELLEGFGIRHLRSPLEWVGDSGQQAVPGPRSGLARIILPALCL